MTRVRQFLARTLVALARKVGTGIEIIEVTIPIFGRYNGIEIEIGKVATPFVLTVALGEPGAVPQEGNVFDAREELLRTLSQEKNALNAWDEAINTANYERLRDNLAAANTENEDLLAQTGKLVTEIDALRAGESEEPAPKYTVVTAPQWIHAWNRATADERLAVVTQIFADQTEARECFQMDHAGAVARRETHRAAVAAEVAEVAEVEK